MLQVTGGQETFVHLPSPIIRKMDSGCHYSFCAFEDHFSLPYSLFLFVRTVSVPLWFYIPFACSFHWEIK